MAVEVYQNNILISLADTSGPGLEATGQRLSLLEKRTAAMSKTAAAFNRSPMRMTIDAVDRATSTINRVSSQALRLGRTAVTISLRVADAATSPIRSVIGMATSLQGLLVAGVAGYGAGQTIAGLVDANSFKENALLGMEVMLKSKEAGAAAFQQAKRYADLSPWTTRDVTTATGQLVSSRVPVNTIFEGGMLADISDLAAANQDTGATLQEAATYFGWLKNARFGEAFENLRRLKINPADLKDYGLKFDKVGSYLGTPDQAIAAVRKVIQTNFGGLTDRMATSWLGFWSTLESTKDTIFQAIGAAEISQGGTLFDLMKQRVKGLTDLIIDENGALRGNIQQFTQDVANAFGRLDSFVGRVFDKVKGIWDDPRFQKADLFGKVQIAWDELISKPFSEWWSASGKVQVAGIMSELGSMAGGGLGGGLMATLGMVQRPGGLSRSQQMLMTGGGPDQLMVPIIEDESPFLAAGKMAGGAFFDAFLAAFDAGKIADKVGQTLKDRAPDVMQGLNPLEPSNNLPVTVAADVGVLAALGWAWKGLQAIMKPVAEVGKLAGPAATAGKGVLAAGGVPAGIGVPAAVELAAAAAVAVGAGITAPAWVLPAATAAALAGLAYISRTQPTAPEPQMALSQQWLMTGGGPDFGLQGLQGPSPVYLDPVPASLQQPIPPPQVTVSPGAVSITITTQQLDPATLAGVIDQAADAVGNRIAASIDTSYQNTPAPSSGRSSGPQVAMEGE